MRVNGRQSERHSRTASESERMEYNKKDEKSTRCRCGWRPDPLDQISKWAEERTVSARGC